MNRSLILTSLAAGGIALAMAACDQQEAAESSSVPMQQQGAMPTDSQTGSSTAPDEAGNDNMTPPADSSDTSQ